MTSENMIKVIEAANSGNYQIVCRAVSGALDAWYITLVDPTDWNWSFNEYRIYVGTKEPPMTDTMNDYSVYFCGYTYYYIDTDGEVKSVTNVNFEENGAQYTSFLRCHEIMTDNITANETGVIHLDSDTEIDKDLYIKGTLTAGPADEDHIRVEGTKISAYDKDGNSTTLNFNSDGKDVNFYNGSLVVDENLSTIKNLKVSGESDFTGDVTAQNVTVRGNLTVQGTTTTQNTNVETLNYKRIEVDATSEVALDSASRDSILVGSASSTNLGIDANELQARNNGAASTLYLNPQGGNTNVGSNLYLSGNIGFAGTRTGNVISFVDGNVNGTGIKIGGAGTTAICSGESVNLLDIAANDEQMIVASDTDVKVMTNLNSGTDSGKTFTFGTDGVLTSPNGFSGNLTGHATSADKSNTSFGLSKFTLTKDDNGGSSCWILISNISSYYDGSNVTTVSPKLGIQGMVFNDRGSSSEYNMTGMTAITCTLAYNAFSLTYRNVAGSTYVIPQVISYNGAYYLALKLNASANNVRFVGEAYGTIDTTQVTSGVTEVTSGTDNEARGIIDIAHPVGSTYVQYPGYSKPSALFAGTTWTKGSPIVYRSSVSGTTANLGTMDIWIRTA